MDDGSRRTGFEFDASTGVCGNHIPNARDGTANRGPRRPIHNASAYIAQGERARDISTDKVALDLVANGRVFQQHAVREVS